MRKDNGEQPSPATISGYRTALNHLFCEFDAEMPRKLVRELKRDFRGFNSKAARTAGALGKSVKGGKNPLPMSAYKLLCLEMMKSGEKDAIFAYCVATLCWNLACRGWKWSWHLLGTCRVER